MFVVFEGIDGSGKTTISNLVAQQLRQDGLAVHHVREGGQFASRVTQAIRDLCRDARNLALTPRAELLLYAAREVQLVDEVLAPVLAEADVVIADRFLYTAEVLAEHGRGLPASLVRPIIDVAARTDVSSDAAAIEPDLVVLVDIDPSVARGRRKIAKMMAADRRSPSRKGLAGSGMQQRLRQGYRTLAARDPGRWITIDNTDQDLQAVVDRIAALIRNVRANGVARALADARAAAPAPTAAPRAPRSITTPREALSAFLDWVDHRARREPLMAAYVLASLGGPGVDERRVALAALAPRVIARGLRGLSDAVSWRLRRELRAAAPEEVALSLEDAAARVDEAWSLRRQLVDAAPIEVAHSLQGLDDQAAWLLRERLWPRAPEAVMISLALLDGARASQMRERWLDLRGGLDGRMLSTYEGARTACRSVTGLDDARAWEIRQVACEAAPVASIASLAGLVSDRAWSWRAAHIERAPKAVLSTLGGLDDPRAWVMRQAMVHRCREALDSVIGLEHPLAWAMREACLDIWPATVVKSLGVLVNGARGGDLLTRALEKYPDNISLLKQAATIATGGHLSPHVMAA